MSAPEKKRPTEVRISVSGRSYLFMDIPKKKIQGLLVSLKDYSEGVIPWREALKDVISHGGEAATALRGARGREGMTQADLAEKLSVPQQNVSEMEKGKRPIGKAMAKRLASIFRVNYRVFL
ncbi:helix-turn-helix transcriptional regulator [Bdellovibrionota bacterium FG-2]